MSNKKNSGSTTTETFGRFRGFIWRYRGPLLLTVVAVVFFLPTLTLRRAYLFADSRVYYYPAKLFFASGFRAGHIPFNCRYLFSGFPLFADSESGIFYLPNIIGYFLPNLASYNYLLFAHYLALALFTYLYARTIKLSRVSSVFAGLSFTFLGFSIAHLGHFNIVSSLAWFPLVLYLVERGLREDSHASFLWAGLVLGLQFLAGFLMMPLFTLLVVFFYILFYPRREKWKARGLARAAGFFAIFAAIGLGLGSIQNFPTFNLVGVSVRGGGVSAYFANKYNLPVSHLVGLGAPRFFGGPLGAYYGAWDFVTMFIYVGIMPLVLAPAALFRKISWHAKFFGGVGLVAVVLSLGRTGLLYRVVHLLPGFNVLKDPSRFMMIFDFALVILAAIGLDRILDRRRFGRRRTRRYIWILAAATVLIIGGLAIAKILANYNLLRIPWRKGSLAGVANLLKNHVHLSDPAVYVQLILMAVALVLIWLWGRGYFSRGVFAALLLTFVVFEVFYTGHNINPTDSSQMIKQKPALVEKLEGPGTYRVGLTNGPSTTMRYQPNTLMMYGIEDAYGYSSVAPKRYSDFANVARGHWNPSSLGLLNIRYLIANLTDVGERKFDVSRSLPLKPGEGPVALIVGRYKARRLEMLSRIIGGEGLPEGFVVANVYLKSGKRVLGPYQVKVGAQTDIENYSVLQSSGSVQRGSAPRVDYVLPGTGETQTRYLGTIGFGRYIYVDGISILAEPAPAGLAYTFRITAMNLVGNGFRPVEAGPVTYMETGGHGYPGAVVYRNPSELPRVFVAGGASIAEGPRSSTRSLLRGVDPARTIVLERGTVEPELAARIERWGPSREVKGNAYIVEKGDNSVLIDAEADDDGLLFWSESYIPGWKAEIDGKPTKIYPAFGALSALSIPKGKHLFKISYHQPGLPAGVATTGITLAIALLGLLWLRTRRPGTPVTPTVQTGTLPDEEEPGGRKEARAGGPDPAANGVSAFFPAFNDEATIERLVSDTIAVLESLSDDFEVIVVDDGSEDGTGEIADRLSVRDPRVRVVHHAKNRGYGGALKSGFASARKGLIFYTDGDGQYDVKELVLLFEKRFEADVVNGYKLKRSDPAYRRVAGALYNWLAGNVFGITIRDVDCDFRLMRKDAVSGLNLESEGGAVCLEMVKKMQLEGFTFTEVAVHHYPRADGRSEFFRLRSLAVMLAEFIRLFWEIRLRPGLQGIRSR